MTIKPVVSAQKRTVGAADVENKEPQSHASSEQSSALSQHAVVHTHRNVVIDGHGQSPKRRSEVFDDLTRHRRSPHKSKRREHHESSQRRSEREKHTSTSSGSSGSKCSSPHGGASGASSGTNSPPNVGGVRGKSPESLVGSNSGSSSSGSVGSVGSGGAVAASVLGCSKNVNSNNNIPLSNKQQGTVAACQAEDNGMQDVEERYSGYNSGDEHLQPKEAAFTADEWQRRDEQFAKCMMERGYILRPVEEDGACLFRAISLQIYGDEGMHDVIRQHTMDYIYKNREYFGHFVTEDINSYIKRKRRNDSHGNHIEIQAMSEIYGRPVEVYCYKPTPINIFNSEQLNNGYVPLRLSYQRGSHYNAIIDPYNATVGVGLGLAGYKPELQTKEAARLSEQLEIEQTMFEDKLKTTDWEATNEAIEEQIARESYLMWCRENLQKTRKMSDGAASTSATVTSAESPSNSKASASKFSKVRSVTATAAAVTFASAANTATIEASGSKPATASVDASNEKIAGGSSDAEAACHQSASPLSVCNLSDASGYELGFDSDDTDRSSTSSIGVTAPAAATAVVVDSASSSPLLGARSKKTKSRPGALTRAVKKRRRETAGQLQAAAVAIAAAAAAVAATIGVVTTKAGPDENSTSPSGSKNKSLNNNNSSTNSDAGKSPAKPSKRSQRDTSLADAIARDNAARICARSSSPDVDQQPSTSKQSGKPERKSQSISEDGEEPPSTSVSSMPLTVSSTSTVSDKHIAGTSSSANELVTTPSSQSPPSSTMMHSSFYQELLEASYAADGVGQLSESEMLQRAIQQSTQDYIEDQKRKCLYNP